MTDTPVPVIKKFRDTIRRLSPPWLQNGLAERILYSFGVQLDAFSDALLEGVQRRFPGYKGAYDSLAPLGRERRIYRGQLEGDAAYAARLTGFFASHRTRGGPYALLTQLYHYFAPDYFQIDLIYYSGRRFTLDKTLLDGGASVDEAITRDDVTWTPDTDSARWARWWLLYYTDQWAVTPPTAEEIAELRLVPRQWNAAHPIGTIVLLPTTGGFWNALDPAETWNGGAATWDDVGTPYYIEVEP